MTGETAPTFGYAINLAEYAKRVEAERLREQADGIKVRTPATLDSDRQTYAADAAKDAERNDRPRRRGVRCRAV